MDQRNCQTDQIASYLDDELDDAALITFEAHLKECFHCKAELAEQRGLLGTLNSAFGHGSDLKLPGDFARIITAHAESDMSGVRGHREHQRALRWCAILSAASLALLGVTTRAYVVGVVRAVGRPVSVVLDLTWTTIYDAVQQGHRAWLTCGGFARIPATGFCRSAALTFNRQLSSSAPDRVSRLATIWL